MFDLNSLSAAVDVRRQELGLSWDQLADELEATASELRSLGDADSDPHITVVMRMIAWTGLGVDAFLAEDDPSDEPAEKAEQVAAFLRADRDLKPESASAIEAVLKAAYGRFATSA